MLIQDAEVPELGRVDVRLTAGRVAAIERELSPRDREPVIDARGGALLPGLHDHHLHLFALAAATESVACGPPNISDLSALARVLQGARPRDGWIRGVGYHESVAGFLDRDSLDALISEHPVRIQHRSGALWVLNSSAIDALGLDRGRDAPGVERETGGRATGRLYAADAWLRDRLGARAAPSLAGVGLRLASYGVTGVTDATAENGADAMRAFADAIASGDLPQRVLAMGRWDLPESDAELPAGDLVRGPVKLRLEERALPDYGSFQRQVEGAHAQGRAVAVHCVTRSELVLAASVFAAAGCRPGDRIEHASVAPPDLVALLADLPLTVVTQPNFILERGDVYLADVEARDLPWLYRCRGFKAAAVPLGGGTDAPFGDPDPWRAMRAAVDRRSAGGVAMGPDEALDPEAALSLFTTPPDDPGGRPRRVAVGSAADLCLLDRPWSVARGELDHSAVIATIRSGSVVWSRESELGP